MYKRSEPASEDMWSQGTRNYGRHKNEPDNDKDSTNNTLEYFISREKTIQVLKQKGVKYLYPIQQKTFRIIFEGSDLIARDRTGSGKTLAFVLPVIERFRKSKFEHRNPKFLIILPTRQLAMQVHNQIQSLRYRDEDDFKSYVVYGKTSIEDNFRRLRDGVDILVATPGRLNDLIERGAVKLQSLEVICLDEADEILKQGFKEQVEKVFSQISKVNTKKIQTLLFSATIPQWLRDLSQQYQSKSTPYINMINDDDIRTSKTIKHLSVEISRLGQNQIANLIEEMVEKYGGLERRILIFCEKKVDVDGLSRNLRIQNQPLHGDVPQSKRQRAYRDFKSGILRCIVATNVAARGLDFPHVDLVIQMSPPINTQEYIHRAGRTGRAGKEGICLTFFDRTRSRIISKIQDEARITIQRVSIDMKSLMDSAKRYERNDSYNQRQERGRNDRYNRNDRDQNRIQERKDYRQERNGRYGDKGRDTSGTLLSKIDNKLSQNRTNKFERNQNRDPRPRSTWNQSRPKTNGGEREDRRRSNSGSPRRGQQPRRDKSRSKSRSFSKERSTSPRRERSGSPKRSPEQLKRSNTSQKSNQDDYDY